MDAPLTRAQKYALIDGLPILKREKEFIRLIARREGGESECFEYQYNMGRDLELDERSIRRALSGVRIETRPGREQIGVPLVNVQPRQRGRNCQTYTVDWEAVKLLSSVQISASGTGQNVRLNRTNCPVEPDKMSGSPPPHYMYLTHPEPIPNRERGDQKGGWPKEITRDVLTRVPRLLQLFRIAVGNGWVRDSEVDELAFVATAHSVLRRSKGEKIRSPGAVFTHLARNADWSKVSQADEEQARVWIRRLKFGKDAGGEPAERITSQEVGSHV